MKPKYVWLAALSAVFVLMLGSGLSYAGWFDRDSHHKGSEHHPSEQALDRGDKNHYGKGAEKKGHNFRHFFKMGNREQERRFSAESLSEMLKSRFDALDSNQDGQINLEEYSARHTSLFMTMDKDEDGYVSEQEMRDHRRHDKPHS